MKLIRTIYMLGLLAGLFVSCSKESPLDGEQYKQVYIVGAYEVVQQFDVAYGDGPQSVCCRCCRRQSEYRPECGSRLDSQ